MSLKIRNKIFHVIIFTTLVTIFSCSNMWDDLNVHSEFQIPVTDINVTTSLNTAQWTGIPIFQENNINENASSSFAINTVRIATNRDKTKLFFQVVVNGILPGAMMEYIKILISNDYSCDGYFINCDYGYATAAMYNICNNSISYSITYVIVNGTGYNNFEFSINTSSFPKLNDKFLISVFTSSISGGPGSAPNSASGSSTIPRWAKLR